MKLSLIISSFNQCKRLRFCLQSALHQKLGPHATEYEVIVADDCSTDGTLKMIKQNFGTRVAVYQNPEPVTNTYTLVENWNNAAKQATGERLIFSNGDVVYISTFIEAHADPTFWDQIILGPAMRTTPEILPYIEDDIDYYKLMKVVSDNKWFTPDMRAGLIAHTYNKEEPPWHVYGYNFSLPRDYFEWVGGFTLKRAYGGEDLELAKKVVDAFGCKCLTNQNAMAFHLYHPQVNQHFKYHRDEYSF